MNVDNSVYKNSYFSTVFRLFNIFNSPYYNFTYQ